MGSGINASTWGWDKMVATRGHPEAKNSRKSSLPFRESRKSTRGALQEPEDEMSDDGNEGEGGEELFWESDDASPAQRTRKTRSLGPNVTFKEDGSLRRSSLGSPQPERSMRKRINTPGHFKNLRRLDSSDCEESEKENVSRKGRRKTADDLAAIEADTDTDEELYSRSRNRRSRNERDQKKSPIKKEFVLNGEDSLDNMEYDDISPRRSSRQSKFSKYNDQSWIIGNKKLRGYPGPANVVSSEAEEEIRPARRKVGRPPKSHVRRNRSCTEVNEHQVGEEYETRSSRSSKRRLRSTSDHTEEEEDAEEVHSRATRRRGPPRRLRDETSDQEESKDDESEDHTEDNEESEGEKPVRRSRRKQQEAENENKDEDNEDDEEEDDEEVAPKRSLRSFRDKDESEVDKTKKHRSHDPVIREARMKRGLHQDFNEEPYCREKRVRRPVERFSYDNFGKKKSSDDSDNDEDEEEDDEDEDEEEDDEEEEEDDEEEKNGSRYSFRRNRRATNKFQMVHTRGSSRRSNRTREDTPPKRQTKRDRKRYLGSPARKHMNISHFKRRATHHSSSTSSSDSDENQFDKRKKKSMEKSRGKMVPMNFSKEDMGQKIIKDRQKVGASLADIDPMAVDRSINFDSIGGLGQHLKSLKEMIIFPLMYPEVFERFKIQPPRGVLFYGPPGTGKTLVARALANECSHGDKKVAFFMRKGADCLSKWVGESERQLRLLFDQAYQMRPSIIFFDEIDGLAPVRSSRQDQIHSSIVSTLLALMDGLDSRGEVVIIGATSRIDAIDPALRRPGRFDREFNFPLPSKKSRQHILGIHTKAWTPLPSKRVLQYLAEQTVGYCGADLKSLCAEACLVALRCKFPQIYQSKQKLLLDVNKIEVKLCHFRGAMNKIIAAGQRSEASAGRRLESVVKPLLQPTLEKALRILKDTFPQGFSTGGVGLNMTFRSHRPRILLTGQRSQGHSTHLAPALIHAMEKLPAHKLDLPALYSISARAPEEACANVFQEARRVLPSIIYLPHINQWWSSTSDTLRATFTSLLYDLDPSSPLLLVATSDCPYDELDYEIQALFSVYRGEVMSMTNPNEEARREFFKPVFYTTMVQKPKIRIARKALPELPFAPPPPQRGLSSVELRKLEEAEEATIRELRIFLREICAKLARNRTFYMFSKPVDMDEVPDYTEIVKNPMDLETMMCKIDAHEYVCAQAFLSDIELICANALEYNPDTNPEDKIIRHRACTLRDMAYAYIKAEMDTDFEYKCRDIRDTRKAREQSSSTIMPDFVHVEKTAPTQKSRGRPTVTRGITTAPTTPCNAVVKENRGMFATCKSTGEIHRKRRRKSAWSRGSIRPAKKKKIFDDKKEKENEEVEEEDKEKSPKKSSDGNEPADTSKDSNEVEEP